MDNYIINFFLFFFFFFFFGGGGGGAWGRGLHINDEWGAGFPNVANERYACI